MRYGAVAPFFDAADVADIAETAEESGWDGLFLAEAVWGIDAWVALTAAAVRTHRLRLGTLFTPLPRWKPWDVASKVATLDRLSGGRVQLSVGLGAPHPGWLAFEEDTGRRDRAVRLDEGLAIYDGLMRGQPFTYDGQIHTVRECSFYPPPPPVQQPRVPVWVVGGHPSERSLRRAARWDGLLPNVLTPEGAAPPDGPDALTDVLTDIRRHRDEAGLPWEGYDVVIEGTTGPGDEDDARRVAEWADAGATWWIESDWGLVDHADGPARLAERLRAGPPTS